MARLVLALTLLAVSPRPAFANNVVSGVVRLPAKYEAVSAFRRPGHWRLPNKVLRTRPPAVDPREEMIVALEGPVGQATASATKLEIEDSRFTPGAIALAPGGAVTVTNRDPVMHLLEIPEIFSGRRVSPGDTERLVFPKPGTFALQCSEVPHLVASVVVAPKQAFATPNAKGEFRFAAIPSGAYKLRVWYAGKDIHTQPVSVRGKRITVEVQLMRLMAKE